MEIPNSSAQAWADLIERRKTANFHFFATRVLVGRLALTYQADPSEATKTRCISELIRYFKTNIAVPEVQQDLQSIFGGILS